MPCPDIKLAPLAMMPRYAATRVLPGPRDDDRHPLRRRAAPDRSESGCAAPGSTAASCAGRGRRGHRACTPPSLAPFPVNPPPFPSVIRPCCPSVNQPPRPPPPLRRARAAGAGLPEHRRLAAAADVRRVRAVAHGRRHDGHVQAVRGAPGGGAECWTRRGRRVGYAPACLRGHPPYAAGRYLHFALPPPYHTSPAAVIV